MEGLQTVLPLGTIHVLAGGVIDVEHVASSRTQQLELAGLILNVCAHPGASGHAHGTQPNREILTPRDFRTGVVTRRVAPSRPPGQGVRKRSIVACDVYRAVGFLLWVVVSGS